ncbi:MAG TPA: hypothetical protein VEL51_22530 [Vicinamibacterales bacterium]|nr:hypothetical protein [Vicinamibacterales bacterium]
MTDSIERALAVADYLSDRGLAATQANIDAAFRALDDRYDAAPNPYAQGLAELRAATATNDESFETRWKRDRQRELDAESARLAEHIEANPPRLTTAEELKAYAAPDIYAEPLRKMREAQK